MFHLQYINNMNVVRINDLHPQTRLDLIEEARWQEGREYVNYCVETNAPIIRLCDWSKTRQGFEYWYWIHMGMPKDQ
jgi:hypothetical protein